MNIELAGHAGRILIIVEGYQYPDAVDQWDGNWLNCNIRVSAGSFSAQFDATFLTQDFAGFAIELERAVRLPGGDASFAPLEEALTLAVEVGRDGSALIKGCARHSGLVTAQLEFSIRTDQSFLASTCDDLAMVASAFPQKGN